MSYFRKFCMTLLLATSVTLLFSTFAVAQQESLDASAHGPADLTAASPEATANPPAAAADPAPPAPLPDTPSSAKAAADSGWRGAIAVYGWFPGSTWNRRSARP